MNGGNCPWLNDARCEFIRLLSLRCFVVRKLYRLDPTVVCAKASKLMLAALRLDDLDTLAHTMVQEVSVQPSLLIPCKLDKSADKNAQRRGTWHKAMGNAMEISFAPLKSSATGWTSGVHFLTELMEWTESYEKEHMLPSEANHQTAEHTVAILLYTVPSLFQSFARSVVYSLMDARLRTAMIYPEPLERVRSIVNHVLAIRKYLLRYVYLPRPHLLRYTNTTPNPDTNGRYAMYYYDAQPYYIRPTLLNHWGPQAWGRWCMGLPLPGDDPAKFGSGGYFVPEIGPARFRGKGAKEAKKTVEKLRLERKAGSCPFA